jgi:hypothetical protein
MKRQNLSLIWAVVGLAGLTIAPSAYAWMLSVDVEQLDATPQTAFEMWLDGNVRVTGGGKDPATNAFLTPNRAHLTNDFAMSTVVRFFGMVDPDGAGPLQVPEIEASPGVKRQFGIFGDGPRVPKVLGAYWANGIATPPTNTTKGPACVVPSVSFNPLGNGQVEITVTNYDASQSTQISQLGYRKLPINSFSIANLNRKTPGTGAGMPPSTFTPSGIADGTVLDQASPSAPGGSVSFTVSGVGLYDDLVVYLAADQNPPSGVSSGVWVAWNSGTYIPARKPYQGRVKIWCLDYIARYFSERDALTGEVASKLPLRAITAVVGPAAFFTPFQFGDLVPGTTNVEWTVNATRSAMLTSTTGPGGLKLSYLRTAAQDVYTDVRVTARILPGGSTTSHMTPANPLSDDFGGPIAIRVGPAGGSYFASIVTGRPNQIDLRRDDTPVGGPVSTTVLATATTWDNGDDIVLDRTDPTSPPISPSGPASYKPNMYDVVLEATGSNLKLTVTELAKAPDDVTPGYHAVAGHTRTLTAVDSTYAEGYIGLRTERDGSLDDPDDIFGDTSERFETAVQNMVIQILTNGAPPLARFAVICDTRQNVDTITDQHGTIPDNRSCNVVNDHEIAQMLIDLGFAADEIGGAKGDNSTSITGDIDNFSQPGAFADNPDTNIFAKAINGNYDVCWVPGSMASNATRWGVPVLTTALIFSENAIVGTRSCSGAPSAWWQYNDVQPPPHRDGDTCSGSNYDGNTGLGTGGADINNGNYGPSNWGADQGQELTSIHILDFTHPLTAGLPVDANNLAKVYAEGQSLMQGARSPLAPGAAALAQHIDPTTGTDLSDRYGVVASEAGNGRLSSDNNQPNPTFPGRTVFLFHGDRSFHRLTAIGREIARRAAYWAANLAIPTSPWMNYGDFNEDGDVDLADFSHFQACFNGPNRPYSFENGCADADIDGDGDVDLVDFSSFQACFNGPNRPPNAGCPTPPISIPGDL